jgi:cytochrome c biogenesis protein ResB
MVFVYSETVTVRLEIALTFKQERIVFQTHCQALNEYAIVNHPLGTEGVSIYASTYPPY